MAANVRFLDNDGVTVITLEDLADAFAGENQTPRKVGYHSASSRVLNNVVISIGAVAGNDGAGQLRLAPDTATLRPPTGFTGALSAPGAGGGWGATGTYGYKITTLNATGESGPQDEITVDVNDTTKLVNLSWAQVAGATGYRIYRTATPGTYGASTLVVQIGSGATVFYADAGAATSAGTPPATNTTAGWKVTPTLSGAGAGGVWGAPGVQYYRVVAYDGTGVELANSLEASINVDVVTKTVTLTWPAVAAAGSFKIFRSTASGVYNSPALAGTAAAGATTFIDNGAAVAAGALSTGPSYGIPPSSASFGTADLTTGSQNDIGQEVYFWLNRVIPAGTPEAGNPRQANIVVKET